MTIVAWIGIIIATSAVFVLAMLAIGETQAQIALLYHACAMRHTEHAHRFADEARERIARGDTSIAAGWQRLEAEAIAFVLVYERKEREIRKQIPFRFYGVWRVATRGG